MANIIEPTVGRIVYFYPRGELCMPPMAAIIVHVWSDTCVNLAIFDRYGNAVVNPPTSVLLVQPGCERPSGGLFCEWMPYQVKKPTGSESGEAAGVKSI